MSWEMGVSGKITLC